MNFSLKSLKTQKNYTKKYIYKIHGHVIIALSVWTVCEFPV